MKGLLPILITLLLFTQGKVLLAQGISSAMGEISTVGFDGPFDVVRNPALLAQEERTGGLGLTLIYQPYDAFRTTPDAEFKSSFFTLLDREFVIFDPDTLLLIGGAVFYFRTDRFAFGMSVSQSYDDEESGSLLRLTISLGPSTSRIFNNTSKREMETQSNMNFAYLVAPGLSLGLQYQFKYKTSSSVEESVNYIGSAIDTTETKEEDTKTYTSTVNMGVLYRTSSLQLGAIVTAGDYSLKRSSYTNIRDDYSPPFDVYDISDVTSLEGTYNGAPGMVLGCLYSLTQGFAIAAEAGFRIPLKYNESDLSPSATGYVEADVTTKNHFGYLLSMGVQYRVDANLMLACGLLARIFSVESVSESTSGRAEQEIDYRLYSLRLGLEKKVFDNGFIVLFSAVDYGMFSIVSSENQSGPGNLTIKFDLSQKVMSVNAGISYIHYF